MPEIFEVAKAVKEAKREVGDIKAKSWSSKTGKLGKAREFLKRSLGASVGLTGLAGIATPLGGIGALGAIAGYDIAKTSPESRSLERAKAHTELALHSSKELDLDHTLLEHSKEQLQNLKNVHTELKAKKVFVEQLPSLLEKFKAQMGSMSTQDRLTAYSAISSEAIQHEVYLPDYDKIDFNNSSWFGTNFKNIAKTQLDEVKNEENKLLDEIKGTQINVLNASEAFKKNLKKAKKRADKVSKTSIKGLKEERKLAKIASRKKSSLKSIGYQAITLGLGTTRNQNRDRARRILALVRAPDDASFKQLAGEYEIKTDSDIYKKAVKLRKARAYSKVSDAIIENVKDKRGLLLDVSKSQRDIAQSATELKVSGATEVNKYGIKGYRIKLGRKDIDPVIKKSRDIVGKRIGTEVEKYFKTETSDSTVALFENKGADSKDVYDDFMKIFKSEEYSAEPSLETLEKLVKENMTKYPNFDVEFQRYAITPDFMKAIHDGVYRSIQESQDLGVDERTRQTVILEYDQKKHSIMEYNANIATIVDDAYEKDPAFKKVCDDAKYNATRSGTLKEFYTSLINKRNAAVAAAAAAPAGAAAAAPVLPALSPEENAFIASYETEVNKAAGVSRRILYGSDLLSAFKEAQKNYKDLDLSGNEEPTLQDLQTMYEHVKDLGFFSKGKTFKEAFEKSPAFIVAKQNKEVEVRAVGRVDLALPKTVQIEEAIDKLNTNSPVFKTDFFDKVDAYTKKENDSSSTTLVRKKEIATMKKQFGAKLGSILAQRDKLSVLTGIHEGIYKKIMDARAKNKNSMLNKENLLSLLDKEIKLNDAKITKKYKSISPPDADPLSNIKRFLENLKSEFNNNFGTNYTEFSESDIDKQFNASSNKPIDGKLPLNEFDIPFRELNNYMEMLKTNLNETQFTSSTESSVATTENLRANLIKEFDRSTKLDVSSTYGSVEMFEPNIVLLIDQVKSKAIITPPERTALTTKAEVFTKSINELNSKLRSEANPAARTLLTRRIGDITALRQQLIDTLNDNDNLIKARLLSGRFNRIKPSFSTKDIDPSLDGITLSMDTAVLDYLNPELKAKLEFLDPQMNAFIYNVNNNGFNFSFNDLNEANASLNLTSNALYQSLYEKSATSAASGLEILEQEFNSSFQSGINKVGIALRERIIPILHAENIAVTSYSDNLNEQTKEFEIPDGFDTIDDLTTAKNAATQALAATAVAAQAAAQAAAFGNPNDPALAQALAQATVTAKAANDDQEIAQEELDELNEKLTLTENINTHLRENKNLFINNELIDGRKHYVDKMKTLYIDLNKLDVSIPDNKAKMTEIFKKINILRANREFVDKYSMLEGLLKYYDAFIKNYNFQNRDLNEQSFIKFNNNTNTLRQKLDNLKDIKKKFNLEKPSDINDSIFTDTVLRDKLNASLTELENNYGIPAPVDSSQFGGSSSQSKISTKLSKHRKRAQSIRNGLVSRHIKKSHHLRESKPYMSSAEKRKTMRRRK